MNICKENPDNLPALDAIGLEPPSQTPFLLTRTQSGRGARQGNIMRSSSVGIGSGFKGAPPFVSSFSEERFAYPNSARTVSMSGATFDPQGLTRTASSGGPGSQLHTGRTRSQRGDKRTDANKAPSGAHHQQFGHAGAAFGHGRVPPEPVAPLQMAENRWDRKTIANVNQVSPELVDRKVKFLLNKLTMERFDSISDQIIARANKFEKETDGRTLIQVIRLGFEKATDEATWSETYARLCRKMMEQISPRVQDDGIRNSEGKPIASDQLFREYLLNRCQGDFERGWVTEEATAAAPAATKAIENQAVKATTSKEDERIMHECVKKLIGNVENPEEEIESLCKLLTTMNIYFDRMKELTVRCIFILSDVIELRGRKWQKRNAVVAPTTIAKVHEAAAKEKAAADKEAYTHKIRMSRGGSRRGSDKSEHQPSADGWTLTGNPRPPAKVGDLSKFGQISKGAPMTFGPSSVFAGKKDLNKRESLSRTNSNANMFQMLQNVEAAELATKTSRPPSRKASVDLGPGGAPEPAPQRKRLNLLPRTKPVDQDSAPQHEPESDSEEGAGDEVEQEMSEQEAKKKISEDVKEFFAVRNIDEAELVNHAIESKEADARLVGDLFQRAASKQLCSSSALEEGFLGVAEFLDDIAIDAPKATDLLAIMIKGADLGEEQRTNIASKSVENGDKLLKLSS
ncbi:armadillo-type protein [Lentinula raphanica]|nr:armadillo-type protein [Lentinula raphanica]